MARPLWPHDEKQLMQLVQPAAVFAISLAVALVVRSLILRAIRRRAPEASPAAIFVETIRVPSIFWALAAALAISLKFAELTRQQYALAAEWIGAFLIVSITLVAASVAVRTVTSYGERQGMPFAVAGMSRALVRVLVVAIGAMTLLAHFEIRITPLLTALGVGGLAVALALQYTLANFFAGLHILMERPIFVGDHIKLDSGQEGIVTDIGWRTTRVRTGGNDMVIVPNVKITSGILLNYSQPEQRSAAELPILVAHQADVAQVCRIALEEAAGLQTILAEPAPLCLFDPGVTLTHLQFKLIFQVASRADQGRVLSDLRLRILTRFRADGIPLPNPELARIGVQ